MSIDLRLPSGLVLGDAPRMLQAKFEEWRWENYDGVPTKDLDRVARSDIDRVYQLGARTRRIAYLDLLKRKGKALSKYLGAIPHARALEDVNLSLPALREPLSGLFDLLLNTKFIKLAGATKLVSPFRPGLIPVIDSVVENYYWFATSIIDKKSFCRVKQANTWGEYVLVLLELIQKDVRGARAQIDRVRRGCANAPYARASRVRIVESLLWYYYARESGQTDNKA